MLRAAAVCGVSILIVSAGPSPAGAQKLNYRGFAEMRTVLYPQTTPSDDDRISLDGRVRFEPAYRPVRWLTLSGSADARLGNLDQVERAWRVDWRDRGAKRPALSVRQASATLREGRFAVDLGKQFIRWGKADILNPTDRLAPRDFLEVTDNDFLAVTAGRIQWALGGHSLDFVWVPAFTPSRIPLAQRRWTALPENVGPIPVMDGGAMFPSGSQFGGRWNYLGSGYEMSLSYFDGFNHLPAIEAQALALPLSLHRTYAPLRMCGADAAVPLPWFTVKGEAAYLTTSSGTSDDLVLYVVQVERQSGELSRVLGDADEIVTASRSSLDFAPDRGLTKSVLGRASYTIDANRNVAVEAAVRRNAKGVWIKTEYSQAYGASWRVTLNGTVIAGDADEFFGRYRRNSHVGATVRYSL